MRFALPDGGKHAALAAALALAILSPLAMPEGWDSFPISSYPMFSRNVGRFVTLGHAVMVKKNGERFPVPPSMVGTPEPMVAKSQIENAIAGGWAQGLCVDIAERARGQGADRIEIVSSTYETRRYHAGDRTPTARVTHACCNVVPKD